jgi:predicted NUDIX family NTP pyrophosphohydrolase
MAKRSAGLIMYRWRDGHLEVFLVHPGGPFWASKDKGAWSIPKGEYADGEAPLEAAKREFFEETGFAPEGKFLELGSIKQSGGKIVIAWAVEGNCNPDRLTSNRCQVEWPPRSGRLAEFPEVDRGDWFSIPAAREHILKSQEPLLNRLSTALQLSEAPGE